MKLDEDALKKICVNTIVHNEHTALLQNLAQHFAPKVVSLSYRDAPWYRLGGLQDQNGKKICDNLRYWIEEQGCEDVISLYETYGDEEFFVTKIVGYTLYFTAVLGDAPLKFVQIEVDVVREIMDRPLFEAELWDDFEELIDPMSYTKLEEKEVTLAHYELRSARCMTELAIDKSINETFDRFFQDWGKSSAHGAGHFSDFWVLNFVRHKGAFGEITTDITPISLKADKVPSINLDELENGQTLSRILHDFDRDMGYPMAWFFTMLVSHKKFHKLAEMVYEDLQNDYAYLAQCDIEIVQKWNKDPYCF